MDEKLSALMDGELDTGDASLLITAMKNNPQARGDWHTCHLIGDALRGEPYLAQDLSAVIAQRLAAEPTALAPRRRSPPNFVRHAMPLAASVAAVGFVGFAAWQLMRANPAELAPQQMAQLDTPAATAKPVVKNRPPQLSSGYLLAHHEFSPSYAVEGTPSLARTVSLQSEGDNQ